MHRPSYVIACAMSRFVSGMYVRHRFVHRHRLERPGPFVLACTHIGHLEPLLLSGWLRRPIHWVAREEFFRVRPAGAALSKLGAIRVDRRGVPVSAIRESVRRSQGGEIIGIFPEGGRAHGHARVICGGAIKGGACVIAMRARVPVVPVVMLGVDRLHRIGPWMPGQRTTIATIVGKPVVPPSDVRRVTQRSLRRSMTAELAAAFVELHKELLALSTGRR